MSAEPTVLTVNAGSSSLRLALYAGEPLQAVASHHAESRTGDELDLADWVRRQGMSGPDVVAHRVVHGGAGLVVPQAIDAAVEAAIERLAPLAPLHNPAALRGVRAARAAWGESLLQVAVFDTAYFAQLPEAAARYALPALDSRRVGAQGPTDLHAGHDGEPVRRYGFHGIAHEAMHRAWRELAPGAGAGARSISLQLGAGASMTATVDGAPVETSMGFTPLEGLVMATRSGDVDPGLLLYLLRERGYSVADLERLLAHESGLRGLAGGDGDMRALLASAAPGARLAVGVYCHRIRKYLGAYLAVLGGADAILFGGGVGEHSAVIRERVLAGLEFAGVRLDRARNAAAAGPAAPIHAADSAVAIWVLAVDEARLLACAALDLWKARGADRGG